MTHTKIAADKLLIAKAKKKAMEWMPFLSSIMGPMRCTATTQVKTAAVDQYGRMYYNPDFFASLGVEVVAYVILHETLHCVLSHCKRTKRMLADADQHKAYLANIAQDLCIQQTLAKEVPQYEPSGIVRLPEWTHIPGITAGRTSEQYYEALLAYKPEPDSTATKSPEPGENDEDAEDEDEEEQESSQGGGSDGDEDDETTDDAEDGDSEGGDGEAEESQESGGGGGGEADESEGGKAEPSGGQGSGGESEAGEESSDSPNPLPELGDVLNPRDAGSNSDGMQKEWEEEPTLADISSVERRLRDVEAALDEMDPRLGSGAGNIRQSLKARLRPMPDPFDQLKHVVSRSIASPVGFPSMTYRKWSRRTLPGDARLPGVERLQPEATVLLDTSGSMLDSNIQQRALAIVAKGINRLQNPRIVCCDGAIQSAKRVANMQRFSWDGGGGTDMAAGLVYVDKTYKPDTIVIITDGITAWPQYPTKAKVICALCRGDWASRIPKWITVVHLYREASRYVL
jgi:predicted metal-dependent peptidase